MHDPSQPLSNRLLRDSSALLCHAMLLCSASARCCLPIRRCLPLDFSISTASPRPAASLTPAQCIHMPLQPRSNYSTLLQVAMSPPPPSIIIIVILSTPLDASVINVTIASHFTVVDVDHFFDVSAAHELNRAWRHSQKRVTDNSNLNLFDPIQLLLTSLTRSNSVSCSSSARFPVG